MGDVNQKQAIRKEKQKIGFWMSEKQQIISFKSVAGYKQVVLADEKEMEKLMYEFLDMGYRVT